MPATTTHKTACRECGASYERKRATQLFCKSACRVQFHNRRQERGAILYDLMMINRHERSAAKLIRAWHIMTRLAMYWRQADLDERGGRKSWLPPHSVKDQTTWALATIVGIDQIGRGGKP